MLIAVRNLVVPVITLALLLAGCGGATDVYDFDNDGTIDALDCGPDDPLIYPEAPDSFGDGVDQDCDGVDGVDDDGDGSPSAASDGDDCNDSDPTIHPGATEIADDNIDQDCDGFDLVCDADNDGVLQTACGGQDCDDTDARCIDNCENLDGDEFRVCEDDCDDSNGAIFPGNPELCDGLDNDCNLTTTALGDEFDDDGDGWLTCADDCDDTDALRFPTNPEVCDGVDNDCDGVVDQGFDDADSDGFAECIDCDDADATAFPDAPESCDGVDNDCDGTVPGDELDADLDGSSPCEGDCDDSDAEQVPNQTWYPDGDGDGFGNLNVIQVLCQRPVGYITQGGDCDDGDATAFPGNPEVCDATDNDCDGALPANEADADADSFMPCTGDCDDTDAARYLGNPEVCDGLDNDCDLSVPADEADADGDGFRICANDCDDADPSEFPGQNWYVDIDGDGFGGSTPLVACEQPAASSLIGTDCDDAEPLNFPGNLEVCDGVDNDCDLVVDETFADGDTDGFAACVDCDDADATAFPGNPEVCDEIDNDCDAVVPTAELDTDSDGFLPCTGDCDDNDAEEQPGQTWYVDADGDGFGDINIIQVICLRPAGYVTTSGDCDDTDANAFPGNPEICDGDDNDCDGALPANEADADADSFMPCTGDCDDGSAARYLGNPEVCDGLDNDCDLAVPANEADGDGDGFRICQNDCDDNDAARFPGNPEVCDEVDNDCDGLIPASELDTDSDGFLPCTGDCDDNDAEEQPGQTWYVDSDGDGFGNLNVVYVSCTRPTGYITDGADCDDSNAAAFPSNPEVCDGFDTDCDGTLPASETDADGDTFRPCTGDCDDSDDARFPGNTEECDGVDNDCDSSTNVSLGELDADGDRFLTCAGFLSSGASNTVGLVLLGGNDCDDADPLRFPTNPEVCDGIDNDCIGSTTVSLGESDVDGDQYMPCASFTPNGGTNAAGLPLLGGDDCDDAVAATNPGLTEVDACDGFDNDCVYDGDEVDDDGDGQFECAGDCDDADPANYLGNTTPELCDGLDFDCDFPDPAETDGDGDGWMLCENDCDDNDPGVAPGLWDPPGGVDNDCDGTSYTGNVYAHATLSGEQSGYGEYFGSKVVMLGDLDQDGLDEVAVGAPLYDTASSVDAGRVAVFLGTQLAGGGAFTASQAWATVEGVLTNGRLGNELSALADVDGDGRGDLLIGGSNFSSTSNSSDAWIFFGATLAAGGLLAPSAADVTLSGVAGGAVASAGDVDGDGLDDVLVMNPEIDTTAEFNCCEGRTYLFLGSTLAVGGTFGPGQAFATFSGEFVNGVYVNEVSSAGDVDGDGYADILIAAASATSSYGRGHVSLFTAATFGGGGDFWVSAADVTFHGQASDELGRSLASIPDRDGDGNPELAIGHKNWRSGLYLIYSTSLATMSSGPLPAVNFNDVNWSSSALYSEVGFSVAGCDLNGDGVGDVLYGNPEGYVAGQTMLSMGNGSTWTFVAPAWGDDGRAVACGGDVDGDGAGDLIIGAPTAAPFGAAYVRLSPY